MKNYPILWEKDPYESTNTMECHKGFGSCDDVSASRLPPASQACWWKQFCRRFTAVDFPVMASWMAFWWIGVICDKLRKRTQIEMEKRRSIRCRNRNGGCSRNAVRLCFLTGFLVFFCLQSSASVAEAIFQSKPQRNFPHPFRHLKKRQET